MNDTEARAVILGEYIAETGATVRETAARFGISKSTVHKDVSLRLPYINAELFRAVDAVLQKNKAERHLRGGYSTHLKYKGDDGTPPPFFQIPKPPSTARTAPVT